MKIYNPTENIEQVFSGSFADPNTETFLPQDTSKAALYYNDGSSSFWSWDTENEVWVAMGGGGSGLSGAGSPEGAVTATPGTTYLNTTNGAFWVKKTGAGNTGWLEIMGGAS